MAGATMSSDRSIAVTLLTGFLGSGKTTLLNHLLAHPDMDESAVIINEFGEVGLDHLVVRELDDDVVLLQSGCICCTVQGQLVEGLKELYLKRLSGKIPKFKRLLIETTGLADPLPILDCLMRDPLFKHVYRVDTVVTTVDAVYGITQLEEHNEAVNQAAVADVILITKTDLVSGSSIDDLQQNLRELNPRAGISKIQRGRIEPADLFRVRGLSQDTKLQQVRDQLNDSRFHHHHHDHQNGAHEHRHDGSVSRHGDISSFCVVLEEPVDWQTMSEWYEEFAAKKADHLLRVKGILNVRGGQYPSFMHCVRSTIHEPWPLGDWPDRNRESRIVFITRGLPREEIEGSLRAHLQAAARCSAEPTLAATAKRWLNQAELSRIFAALSDDHDWHAANAVRLALVTGVIMKNVQAVEWEEFDLSNRVWHQKVNGLRFAKGTRNVPLHLGAVLLLQAMRDQCSGSGRLFPHDASFTHRVSNAWERACRSAEVHAVDVWLLPPILATDIFANLSSDLIAALLGIDSCLPLKVGANENAR